MRKKEIESIFTDLIMLLIYAIWEYLDLRDHWYSSRNFNFFFLSDFGTNVSKYILENI